MASEEKANVIHRSCRGRTGVDVKAKTDSGCFVDDELEKQTLGEKSPPTKKDDLNITKSETQDTSCIPLLTRNTQREADCNSVPQNVVGSKEMSRENENTDNIQIHGDLESDEDVKRSAEIDEPREDFYCLYYSNSPNGSLTRRKEKSPSLSHCQEDKDVGASAKELLKKINEDVQKESKATEFRFDEGPPPVAPKPKQTTKEQYNSNINIKDPILCELEMLGSTVGRDFTIVEADNNDFSLLSNAVRELHVAQTPEECFDRLDAIQTALKENINDTLERNKAKSKKNASRKKSLPEENKVGNVSETQKSKEKEKSSQIKNSNTSGKKAESPQPGKKRFEPIKVSRTEFHSLNSMREDSHHKRSHMNADSAKPVSTRSETYRTKKPDVPKRLSEKSDSSKTNTKKDQKLLTPQKGGKPSTRKPIASNGSKDVSKKQERLELRSNRGRRRGDLSSIPENAVMDEKKERRRSDEVIPLAKGEDLSSEEDNDELDDASVDDNGSPSVCPVEEENVKQSPTSTEEINTVSTSGAHLTNPKSYVSENSASSQARANIVYDETPSRGIIQSSNLIREEKNTASDRVKDQKNLHTNVFDQQSGFYSYRGRDQNISDGWTSESTAGYSSECSANDADDEGDKRAEYGLTDNIEAYDDPVDIVDMTFGSQMNESFEREANYIYAEESFQQPERNRFVEVGDSVPTYYYPEGSQDQFEDPDEFAFQEVPDLQDATKTPAVYEFLEEAELGPYGAPERTNPEYPSVDVDRQVQRQTVKRNTIEEQFQHNASRKPKKVNKEESPDPSGFMTVQDIKRLIFQGRKPSMPRATSFCGTPSSPIWRNSQGQETFQRRSWSGYGVQQKKEPGIDPLVRNFPQKSLSSQRLPKGEISKSPYVRTVSQRSNPQFGCNSDTQLNALNEEQREYLARSRSFGRTPLQSRSYSLETYHSDNSISDSVNVVPRQPSRPHLLVRSASDCSSNYSQEHSYTQLQRTTETPRNRRPAAPQYIDAEELAVLISPRSPYTGGRDDVLTLPLQYHGNSHVPQYQLLQNQPNDASFRRHPSERSLTQTLWQASQPRNDSESDGFVSIGLPERSDLEPSIQQFKLGVTTLPNQKTLSERFSEVPQRVSFEELAEKLDLGSDSEDEVDYVSVVEKPDSEFGAELEFDNGDYFDDKNMIVGEAMRLKKVLGSVAEQDPELETLVTATTDPKLPKTPQALYTTTPSKISHKQEGDAVVFQRPPPYHGARRKSPETSGSDYSSSTPIVDVPPLYESETESYSERIKSEEKLKVVLPHDQTKRQVQGLGWKDSEARQHATEKAISADELLKLLLNASQGSLEKSTPLSSESKSQQLLQNLNFPKHPTKAASTGNIHSDGPFPGHASQLYDNSAKSFMNRRRQELQRPTCHKSEECIRKKQYLNRPYGVLQAKMIGSECNTKKHPKRVFEEEVDCMKTKDSFDFSSGEISTSGSSIDDVVDKKEGMTSVAFIGYEKTKEIETLPRVKFSSQRKRRKAKTGYLSDQDIPTVVNSSCDSNPRLEKSSEDQNDRNLPTSQFRVFQNSRRNDGQEDKESSNNEKASTGIQDSRNIIDHKGSVEVVDLKYYNDNENKSLERSENLDHVLNELPHDDVPSPNSVNVFIDYNNKNVMMITTSTPKIHHAKLVTPTPQGISPVPYEKDNEISSPREKRSSFGEEEFPPRYQTSPSSDRSSSVYSSDDEKFFGSCDTVVFVDKTDENSSVKPNVDNTTFAVQDQEPSTSNGDYSIYDNDAEKAQAYSRRVDSLLQEVRSSLDLDSIGSDLLEQAMERVKDKLSPCSSENQGRGGITMEAFVALHQADELQAIIQEIKGELWILQQENTLLKEKVVSLQHGEACSTSESTEDSLTESAERIDSIRRQIAAVVATKQKASEIEDNELISVDVFLRGYGCPVGLKHAKKTDVKLGTVKVKGGTDWSGVYDAAKTTFLDHVKRIDPCSCLGLGPTSMYGAQIGATMLTPETLRRKNPRVEISRKLNSCVIQLRDGMTESFDTLVYDTLIPRPIVEGFVHQILENRFIVLCGAAGLGKTFLAMKLAEHLAQRFGSKNKFPVLSLAVGQTGRKELKRTLANLMKSDISSPSSAVPVVIVLDQLDSLASLADIFDSKQLEGNRNSPFIIGVRNKSKKGPFSSKDLAIYKYFRWIQMSVHDRHVLGLLERFLRSKLSCMDDVENEEDLLDLFLWLTQVWQKVNQILQSYVDVEVTIGPSVFYSCPMDMYAAEGWFANVWNYTLIPYLHQNLRNSSKIYERNVPWECPTKWVIMRWPWNREKSKVLATLKKLRQVDVVLNRNFLEFTKGNNKESHPKTRKLLSTKLVNQSPSKAGSLESWSTADWDAVSLTSEVDSIASSSTL